MSTNKVVTDWFYAWHGKTMAQLQHNRETHAALLKFRDEMVKREIRSLVQIANDSIQASVIERQDLETELGKSIVSIMESYKEGPFADEPREATDFGDPIHFSTRLVIDYTVPSIREALDAIAEQFKKLESK